MTSASTKDLSLNVEQTPDHPINRLHELLPWNLFPPQSDLA
jgi:hypothetical protein